MRSRKAQQPDVQQPKSAQVESTAEYATSFPTHVYILGIFVAYAIVTALYHELDIGKMTSPAESSDPANPRVFFDIEIDDEPTGRIVFELFSNIVPKTAENFRALSTGEKGKDSVTGKPLHYQGSAFHRVIPGFMCQGGDITKGNGKGGLSIYKSLDGKFEDENFQLRHDSKYLLSMANSGSDSNGSQFFITVAATSWLDKKHVVFGIVQEGGEIVAKMDALGSKSGKPAKAIRIAKSGQI